MANSVVRALRRPRPAPSDRADLTHRPSPYKQEPQWKSRADRQLLHALTPAPTSCRRQRPPQQLIGGSRLSENRRLHHPWSWEADRSRGGGALSRCADGRRTQPACWRTPAGGPSPALLPGPAARDRSSSAWRSSFWTQTGAASNLGRFSALQCARRVCTDLHVRLLVAEMLTLFRLHQARGGLTPASATRRDAAGAPRHRGTRMAPRAQFLMDGPLLRELGAR